MPLKHSPYPLQVCEYACGVVVAEVLARLMLAETAEPARLDLTYPLLEELGEATEAAQLAGLALEETLTRLVVLGVVSVAVEVQVAFLATAERAGCRQPGRGVPGPVLVAAAAEGSSRQVGVVLVARGVMLPVLRPQGPVAAST